MMKSPHITAEPLKEYVASNYPGGCVAVVSELGNLPMEILDGRGHPCPVCNQGEDCFHLIDDDSGGAICRKCHSKRCGDVLSTIQWRNGWSFTDTLKRVAEHVGYRPSINGNPSTTQPSSNGRPKRTANQQSNSRRRGKGKSKVDPAAKLDFKEWNDNTVALWALEKCASNESESEIAVDHARAIASSVRDAGGRLARYYRRYTIVAIPIWGPQLASTDPVGWCVWNVTGGNLPVFDKNGKIVEWVKVKNTFGSERGLMMCPLWNSVEEFQTVNKLAWKVEGGTDLLSVASSVLANGHSVFANAFGTDEKPQPWMLELFEGQNVNTIHDADEPGVRGGVTWSHSIAFHAETSRHVRLPYDVKPSHGPDARDYLNEGHSYDDLLQLASAAEVVEPSESTPHIKNESDDSAIAGERHDIEEFCNYETITADDGSTEEIPLPLNEIIDDLHTRTDNWPRLANGILFVDEGRNHDDWHPAGKITRLPQSDDLFAFIQSRMMVSWATNRRGCVTKREFFSRLRQSGHVYESIEFVPHFPQLFDCYYCHPNVAIGDGTHLNRLLNFFCPAGMIDRDLIEAAIVSLFWGQAGGECPAFVITGPSGRGIGKTSIAKKLGELVDPMDGGFFSIEKGEKSSDLKKRLLTENNQHKRIVLIDNIKSSRLTWPEIESMVTAGFISGHRMYQGEGTRRNNLLWILTLNGPAMSKDMAQRSVVVHLAKPEYRGDWDSDVSAFIREHRQQIIDDVAAFFQREKKELRSYTRWGRWDREILSRLAEPNDAQQIIKERQVAVDMDNEDAAEVEEYVRKQLDTLGYDPADSKVHIPNPIFARWFEEASNKKRTTTAITRDINQWANEGISKHLSQNQSRSHGRGILWTGETATGEVAYDLEGRSSYAP